MLSREAMIQATALLSTGQSAYNVTINHMRIEPMKYWNLKPKEAMLAIEYIKDCDLMRAARCTNHTLEEAQELMQRDEFKSALDGMIQEIQENTQIDKEWLLSEAADNHRIARATGNLGASNSALKLIGQHQHVDAFAAEKVEIKTDKELMERLLRGRQRARIRNKKDDDMSFL